MLDNKFAVKAHCFYINLFDKISPQSIYFLSAPMAIHRAFDKHCVNCSSAKVSIAKIAKARYQPVGVV